MKRLRVIPLALVFTLLVSFGMVANATVFTIADSESIEDTLAVAMSGDTLMLEAGGVYDGFDLDSKVITVMGPENDLMPVITSDINITGSGSALEINRIEMDGMDDNSYAFNFESDMDSTTYLKVKNCVIHNWDNTFLRANRAVYRCDSIMVDNTVMYHFSYGSEYDLIQGRDRLLTNYISFTNSTIYDKIGSFFRVAQDSLPMAVILDHLTINSAVSGDGNYFFDLRDAPAGSRVVFTNSIMSNFSTAGDSITPFRFSDAMADTIQNVRFYNIEGDTSNTWNMMEDFSEEDPQYADAANGNFALPEGSALLTAATDGGPLGDPRWGTYNTMPPAPAMITQWMMDEGSGMTVADAIGGATGTMVQMNGDEWTNSLPNQGMAIDFGAAASDSAAVEVADVSSVSFDSTQNFSISVLVKADPLNITDPQAVFIKGSFGADQQGRLGRRYQAEFKDGEIRFAVDDDVDKTQLGVEVPANYPVNQWANLVYVRDLGTPGLSDASLKIYLNGELIGKMYDATKRDITSIVPLYFGNTFEFNNHLQGALDDVRMYNYALSADEVSTLFDSYDFTPKTAVAYWKFDEGEGMTAADELGMSDADLMYMEGNEWMDRDGGSSIDFTMATDTSAVEVSDNSIVEFDSTDSFTLSALVKNDPVTNMNPQAIMIKGSFKAVDSLGWEGTRYQMEFKDGELRVAVDDDSVKTQLGVDITNGLYYTNEWNHVVGVRDLEQDSLFLYLNGELIGSMEDGTVMDFSSGDLPFMIGNTILRDNIFDGQIDEVKLYNYALQPDEVMTLFNSYGLDLVGTKGEIGEVPMSFALKQNYPNPFNPTTTINFNLPKANKTTLTVYNLMGQQVTQLVNKRMEAGTYSIKFDGSTMASGMYFYRLRSGDYMQVKKMMLLK